MLNREVGNVHNQKYRFTVIKDMKKRGLTSGRKIFPSSFQNNNYVKSLSSSHPKGHPRNNAFKGTRKQILIPLKKKNQELNTEMSYITK